MEYVAIVGNSGNDTATLHDSAGNDAFQAGAGFRQTDLRQQGHLRQ